MNRLAIVSMFLSVASFPGAAWAVCSTLPRIVLENAGCSVGQSCPVSVRLDPGNTSIAGVAAKLEAADVQCDSCTQEAAASGGACFLNTSNCTLTIADLSPPLTAFSAGVIATVQITCSQPGPHDVTVTGLSMGGTDGLPIQNPCGQGVTIQCIGAEEGEEPICGDVNDSGSLTSSDALAVLKAAVGQEIALRCQPAGQTLETGQTTCMNMAGDVASCAGSGQDGERRDGLKRKFNSNVDGTIFDELTGLMWEKLSDDESIHDHDAAYDWHGAVASRIAALNAASFAGYDDWRLPNVNELLTLIDYGNDAPATFSPFDDECAPGCAVSSCSCTSASRYWTSTPAEGSPGRSWTVDFDLGGGSPVARAQAHGVRAVRSGF